MYFLLFLVWVVFNGQFTLEIAVFGIFVAAAVYWFICRFLDWSPKKDLFILKKSGQILRYFGLLIWEILKANFAVIRMILSPKVKPDPVIVSFKTRLQSKTARVLLANSITLTPGTITVSLREDEFTVHCLDRSFSDGLEGSSFEKALLKMEE